jgi:DNA repair exonuclease SbcCD nuclease subunit
VDSVARTILHLADLHLDAPHRYLGDAAEARAREADGVLERLAEWLLAPGAPAIGALLIAGDLFDSPWPDDAKVERAAAPLRRLERSGVRIVTLPGNHDEWTYADGVFRRWLRDHAWPGTLVTNSDPAVVASFDLDELSIEVASCAYHQGRSRPSIEWENPFPAERGENVRRIGLFHGTLRDRIRGPVAEGERAFPLEIERLSAWGIDYLALGHIHRRQSFTQGSCLAHYPGPLEGKGPFDAGAGVLSFVDVAASPPKIQIVDARASGIRSRDVGLLDIDLVRCADAAALERRIRDHFAPNDPAPILRVELTGRADFPFSVEELRRRLAGTFLHLEIEATEPARDLGDWKALASQRTLEGAFVRKILEKVEAAPLDEGTAWLAAAEAGLHALRGGRR